MFFSQPQRNSFVLTSKNALSGFIKKLDSRSIHVNIIRLYVKYVRMINSLSLTIHGTSMDTKESL